MRASPSFEEARPAQARRGNSGRRGGPSLPLQAPASFEKQQRQADSHDPERDERAAEHDARGGREDARPVGPHLQEHSLAEELIQRTPPGQHVAPLQRAVAVVCRDPPFGPHANLDVFTGPRARGRQRLDVHREVEPAVFGPPVAAIAVKERRLAERGHGGERHLGFDLAAPPEARPANGHPRRGKFLAEDESGFAFPCARKEVGREANDGSPRPVESESVVLFPCGRGAPNAGRQDQRGSGPPVESGPSLSMAETTLLLVDGNNLLFRSFFAMPRLTRSDGLPNGALHGYVATLRKILREEAPELAAVAFDAPGPTFRHEAYPEYKANRPEMPPELAQQVPFTRDLSRVLGVTVVEIAGVEADDVIGTLARAGSGRGYRVLVVSGDKDLLQLVDDRVSVVPPADTAKRIDRAGVEAKLKVPPEFVPDYLGLVGDSVDNIPGVPGIGPKTAATLIASFGGVEEILAHTGEIARKRTAALLDEHAPSARISRELAVLRLDVPVPEAGEDLDGLRYRGPRMEDARKLLEDLELRTHARDLAPAAPARLPRVRTAAGPRDVVGLLKGARDSGRLSVHATFGPARGRDPAPLAALGLASSAGEGLLVAVDSRIGEADLVEAFGPALSGGLALVGHGVQPFVRWWLEQGGGLPEVAHDSQVAAWLLNTTRRAQGFGDVLRDYVGLSLPEPAASQATLFGSAAPDERLAIAAAWQHRLTQKLDVLLEAEKLSGVFRKIEMPLLPVLARIETRGICLDSETLRTLSKDLLARLEELTARIHELAGTPFDIQSPKQLGEILFDKLQLPQTAKTQKTKRASTRAGVLEELALYHEVPRLVLEYREVAKLKSTYVDPLPELVAPGTGRLHTRLHQAVAATGRLSSSDPNLQNIPVRSDLGRQVRTAFVAAPGKRLLSADYSQIELRILAHLSGDPVLTEAFRSGEDIHARTAEEVFGDFGLSPPEARRRAKIVNFSVIYGKTAFTLAKEIGVSTGEAKAFIDAYFDRYARVRDLIGAIREEARTTGRVTTLFGRQRHIPEIRTTRRARREAAERMAVNAPIQGTAADLIKIAMLGVDRALEPTSGVLLLQVHDELLIEVDSGEAEAVGELVRGEMESVAELQVPLVADVTIADSWEH